MSDQRISSSKRRHPSFVRRGVLCFATLTLLAVSVAAQKQAVQTAEGPKAIGPYSQAIIANGFVFTSGQIGTDPKTGSLVGDIVEQTERALQNVETILKASGTSMDNVVKTTVFLADMNEFSRMNEVYEKYFKAPFPARSTVEVAKIPRGAKVEIEVVALVGRGRAKNK